jgi:hypothetical protein
LIGVEGVFDHRTGPDFVVPREKRVDVFGNGMIGMADAPAVARRPDPGTPVTGMPMEQELVVQRLSWNGVDTVGPPGSDAVPASCGRQHVSTPFR